MAESGYNRKSSAREDPRLARHDKNSSTSEKTSLYDGLNAASKHKGPEPAISSSTNTWQGQQSSYTQSMQSAYQHLPPTMYTDQQGQYSAQGYPNVYSAYQQAYGAAPAGYNHYQGYGHTQPAYTTGSIQPGPPGDEYPQTSWAPVGGYNNSHPQPALQNQPPPNAGTVPASEGNSNERKEAVAQELKQQKAQLIKQREDYVKKAKVLHRELELLRNQKQELLAEHSPEHHDTQHILRENSNLQNEIQVKLKAITNVVEMLSSIIKDGRSIAELEEQLQDDTPPRHRKEKEYNKTKHNSSSVEKFDMTKKYNYFHYDPELHWCRTCDVFPKTAKDFLLHLQSEEHKTVAQERDMKDDTPWHHLPPEPELPFNEGAPKKRLPIKGLQFFIPAPAWYCKLCDTWIGDLHCASQHLKSQTHSQNYANFVEQNPHWEIEWLKDREKALARTAKHNSSDSDDNAEKRRRKRKDKHLESLKDKKKKKRSKKRRHCSSDSSSSSSSSSDSSTEDEEDTKQNDKSKSIRVAMRNVKVEAIMNEDLGSKWEMLGRLVEEHKQKEAAAKPVVNKPPEQDDRLINQWMTISEPPDKEKRLLDSLKDRMKLKQQLEKVKLAEIEKKQREKEREVEELVQKKEKEAKDALEKEEESKRERERQEFERIRNRDREQVRFKTTKDTYRKHSPSASPDRNRNSRSPSSEKKRNRHRSPMEDRRHYSENGRSSTERRRSDHDDPHKRKHDRDSESHRKDRKPPPPPSYKKLPFIGRMPLFKNKKPDDKTGKEIKKEDYETPRQTRFQPGNLARAFIPEPEVVCFPKLSSIPPITIPPPRPTLPPAPPKITEAKPPKAPPPPKIGQDKKEEKVKEGEKAAKQNKEIQQNNYENAMYSANAGQMGMDPSMMAQYQYTDYNMMYQHMYDFSQDVPTDEVPPEISGNNVPLAHTLPLQPPPLPPDDPNDDLAMLGISVDDMAAQMF